MMAVNHTASVQSPQNVVCPNCNAQPGEPCTQPDNFGRHPVKSFHYARVEKSQGAEPEDA